MITKDQLRLRGFHDPEHETFSNHGCLEKKIGRSTYTIFIDKKDRLNISVFVPQDPNELWSMSMWSKIYAGKCDDMVTFDYIMKLVAIYE